MCDLLPSDSKSKTGRKGDPRMHRAVSAKLKDPDMSLLDALVEGGFEFPEVDKNDVSSKYSLKDKDGVLLGQRKNQLSRRLREAKNQMHLNKKKQKNGSSTSSAICDTEDAPSQSSASAASISSAKRTREGETSENNKPSLTNLSVFASLKPSSKYPNLPVLSAATLTSNKHQDIPTLQQQKTEQEKQNDAYSTGSYTSIFSGKLEEFDSFRLQTIPKPAHAVSHPSHYMTNDIKSENKTKTNNVLHSATSIENSISSKKLSPVLSSTFVNKLNCFKNDHLMTEPKISNGENDSIATDICLHPKNAENKLFLKKAMNLFEADIHNYIQSTMTKAGYPHCDTSEQSAEYLIFFTNAINTQIDRIQKIRSNAKVTCSSVRSPLKNGSDNVHASLLKDALGYNNLQATNQMVNSTRPCLSQRNQPANALLSNISSFPLSKKSQLEKHSNASYKQVNLYECQGATDGESKDTA